MIPVVAKSSYHLIDCTMGGAHQCHNRYEVTLEFGTMDPCNLPQDFFAAANLPAFLVLLLITSNCVTYVHGHLIVAELSTWLFDCSCMIT